MGQNCASAIIIGVLLKFNCLTSSYFVKLALNYSKGFTVTGFAAIKHFGRTENVTMMSPGVLETGLDSALKPKKFLVGKNEQSNGIMYVFQAYAKITPKGCVMIQAMMNMMKKNIHGKKHVMRLKCTGAQTIQLAFIRT